METDTGTGSKVNITIPEEWANTTLQFSPYPPCEGCGEKRQRVEGSRLCIPCYAMVRRLEHAHLYRMKWLVATAYMGGDMNEGHAFMAALDKLRGLPD